MAIRPPTSRGSSYDLGTPTKWNAPMATKITAKEKKELLEMDDQIADRIREASETRNITNRELAKQMDVAERTVNDWKANGQVSRKNIPLLCKVLDGSVGWLMTGEEGDYGRRVDTEEDNVIKLAHTIKGGPMADRQVTYTHVPIVEVIEIESLVRNNPKNWRDMAKDWAKKQDRGAFVIPTYDDGPGIPSFAVQCMTKWFDPHIMDGAFMGFATDIVPALGDLAAFVVKKAGTNYWTYIAGYWEPTNWRSNTFRTGDSFDEITEFTLRMKPDTNSSRDVTLTRADNEFEYIGTLVYSAQWNTWDGARRHTGYLERAEEIALRRRYERD